MSKVLIDRALLERAVYSLELAYTNHTAHYAQKALTAGSGTPVMPVKAYYYEAPNEYGGLNKSVGLEVRKTFIDTPLVLESDALAQIACLEGEIAKRDARIVELEGALLAEQMQAEDLSHELAAIKAQEPVAWRYKERADDQRSAWLYVKKRGHVPGGRKFEALYAAPVSEAKAQGVVMLGRDAIREVFMRNGFTIKEGQADLKPYVYAAADEPLRLAAAPSAPKTDDPVKVQLLEALKRIVATPFSCREKSAITMCDIASAAIAAARKGEWE